MTAVKEKKLNSAKTYTSLYNRRSTGTGSTNPDTRDTFDIYSIQNDKNEVVVENGPYYTKQRFIFRFPYGIVLKVEEIIIARYIECYI